MVSDRICHSSLDLLRVVYFAGTGVAQDLQKALEWLTRAAEKGSSRARHLLSLAYEEGEMGVDQNYEKAVYWLAKAAEQTSAEALGFTFYMRLYLLCRNLEDGSKIGSPRHQEAIAWLCKAAEEGCDMAQYGLSLLYKDGEEGFEPNDAKALEWLRKAAAQQNPEALVALGRRYIKGDGVVQSDKKGADCWSAAAKLGYSEAQFYLGMIFKLGLCQ